MDSKKIFTIGIISLVIFVGIASYLWYLYFNEYEGKLVDQNGNYNFIRGVELINNGGIDYINASADDDKSIIPSYYFRVKNNTNQNYKYVLYFQNANGNDGCTSETTFSRDELEYELKLDNRVIKSGNLATISNNVLDVNTVNKNSTNDYSLKVWLKSNVKDTGKHFHYIVTIKEQK